MTEMETGTELPTDVEELTAEWLTEALQVTAPGVQVRTLDVTEVIWGTATKVRIVVDLAGGPDTGGPPSALCVKGGFDPRVREALGAATDLGTRTEAAFFRDVAPELRARLPRSWFADASDTQGIVVLDDLNVAGSEFGAPTSPWTPDRVERGLVTLAGLHGETWGRSFPGIGVGSTSVRGAAQQLFSAAHWDAHFSSPGAVSLPPALRDRERILRGYRALWAADDSAEHCLTHGDAHLGNTYIDSDGRPLFLDWASPSLAPWSYDVAYFLVGALDVDERRGSEQDLLRAYLAALAAAGGPQIAWDEAWASYRRHTLHGLIWATVPPTLQSPENVAAMTGRYVAAVEDHDPLGALGV